MRRPLCLLALVVTAVLWLLLFIVGTPEDPYASLDGETMQCTARVVSKEYKRGVSSWSGEETLTLLLSVDQIRDSNLPISVEPSDAILVRVPIDADSTTSVLANDGNRKARTDAALSASVVTSARALQQSLLASDDAASDADTIEIGSRIRIHGTVSALQPATNHGGFDGYLYYRTLGYVFQIRKASVEVVDAAGPRYLLDNVLDALRTRLRGILYACCRTDEDADVLAAMLLGEKGWLSQEIKDLYQSAGIIHVLAISGLHIAILGMGCYRALCRAKAPRAVCSVIPVILMLLYGRMTGMSASAVRAIIMFLLHMLARTIHRTYDLLTALSVAGLLLMIQQPLYLYNAGFQFSFGAVLSIGLLTEVLPADILTPRGKSLLRQGGMWVRQRLGRQESLPLPRVSLQGLAVTIGTYPVNLAAYGTFPLYAVFLNALVLPLMSLLMPAGLILLATGLILVPLGQLAGFPVHYFLHFYLVLCAIAQGLPGHTQIVGHPEPGMIALYLLLLALLVLARRRGQIPGVLVLLYLMGAMELITWHAVGGLGIHVIDVGQGDGLYMECDGSRILVDGGSTDQSEVARYDLEPLLTWYGADEIDLAIMTHEDEDHMNGLLELLAGQAESGIWIHQLAVPDVTATAQGDNYRAVVAAAEAAGTEVLYLHRGMVLRTGNLAMTCLGPVQNTTATEPNETSVVLYLTYGSFTGLLTGDLEGAGESDLLEYMTMRPDLFPLTVDGDPATADPITFLKVAHHGSKGATTAAFLAAIRPRYAAISCGQDNRYGHPHAETLERLTDAGAEILDTRYTGEITITTDGRTMTVETFRNQGVIRSR